LILCNLKWPIPGWVYFLVMIAYSLLLFYGSYRVDSGFYIQVICSAKTTEREIAISFDDGPAPEYSPEILRILKEYQVHAAFFCIGNRIEGNEQLVRQMHEGGHVIGNHSFSHHPAFDLFSSKAMSADLQQMDQEMFRVTGLTPRMFRPPYGVTNPPLKKAIILGNYIPVGWSIRSLDTVISNEKKLFKKVMGSLAPGAVLLFHDTSKTTVAILPAFIRAATAKGYRFVRLDKMLKLEPYT
jgi:peptidoglycan/xylan/chitin deacetylase (PgdA/CDA1 family)